MKHSRPLRRRSKGNSWDFVEKLITVVYVLRVAYFVLRVPVETFVHYGVVLFVNTTFRNATGANGKQKTFAPVALSASFALNF